MNTPACVQSQKDVGLPRRLRPGSRSLTERAIPCFEDIQSEPPQNCGSHERVRLYSQQRFVPSAPRPS
jgi:hypothetical protein